MSDDTKEKETVKKQLEQAKAQKEKLVKERDMLAAVFEDKDKLEQLKYHPPIYENDRQVQAEKFTGILLGETEEIQIPKWLVKLEIHADDIQKIMRQGNDGVEGGQN